MCNQANLQEGAFVLDPFVGTGSLLIAPASLGAFVFGYDLDMRVLNGYSVGRINKNSTFYSPHKNLEAFTPKIDLNFEQYGLLKPNIMRMDCTKCFFAPHALFDAIITDPPYGIRAMSRSTMKKQENKVEIGEAQQPQS
jgi:tRNA (guanine10-N2)-methyltransferase